MSDEMNEAAAEDPSVAFCNWMILLTTVGLLGAFLIVESILSQQYGQGMLK